MKDYYAILGIHPASSEAEIKRAYRRLAVTFHPDKNPDPEAENLFKEINEAYDIIGDPEKKRDYDLIIQNYPVAEVSQSAPGPPRRHRDPAYHRKYAPGPRPKGERERMHEFMARYLPVAHRLTVISSMVALFFLLDYTLPKTVVEEKIAKTTLTRISVGRSNKAYWTITTADGRRFEIDLYLQDHFPRGGEVRLRLSPMLNIPLTVEGSGHRERVRKSMYGNFIFAPVVLLFSAIIALLFRKDVEKGFNYGIVSFLSMLLALAIYLILH